VPIRRGCRDAITIDRFDLWRGGTYALRVDSGGRLHIESVAATLGDRPWVLERMREGIRRDRLIGDPAPAEDEDDESTPESSGDID
jgi:hypothetical protein